MQRLDGVQGHPASLRVDLDRERRCGFPEVIYGAGKSREELLAAAASIYEHHGRMLLTRVDPDCGAWLARQIPGAEYRERARCVTAEREPRPRVGRIVLLSAGTADLPVAEEARVTAEITGNVTETFYDVGVAGLHRLLGIRDHLERARAIVVVAGMDGALPSVVAGLVGRPVIGVPTSAGYGAAFGGTAALLAMLNSCATGLAVVNIDNGFGAAMLASRINQLAHPHAEAGPS